MPTIGSLKEYNEKEEDWESYVERLEQYFIANDIHADKKVAVLISTIGANTYGLMKDILAPAKPHSKSFAELTSVLKSHLSPEPITIAERFRFYKRDQGESESISDYIAVLKRLSSKCRFGLFLDDALRDRLVCGLRDRSIQERLLSNDSLDFKKACNAAITLEQALADVKLLQGTTPTVTQDINFTSSGKLRSNVSNRCKHCGNKHTGDCWFKNAVCHRCQQKGHTSRTCKKKPVKKHGQESSKKMHKVDIDANSPSSDNETNSDSDANDVHSLSLYYNNSDKQAPITVDIKIHNQPVTMEIDTGSAVSVISANSVQKLLGDVQLKKTNNILKTYTGEGIKPAGILNVEVDYKDQHKQLTLHVLKQNGPTLLGRDWLKEIKLDWSELKCFKMNMTSMDALLDKYGSVFDSDLGTIKDFKARIYLKPDSTPKFFKPRPIAYALKPKVEVEIDRLIHTGVLVPVTHSEWATPIVPVVKKSGAVRICGDFKVTLNSQIKVDQYPIPKIEDILAQMSGEKFSKIDLANAYLQMEIAEEDKRYTTINTSKGLFSYNRLPFGIASAPAQFQRAMEQILQNCPGTQVYFDDIIITGKDDNEHIDNVERVLSRLQASGIRLKREKCEFMKPSMSYLGHIIDKDGLHTDKIKVKAIVDSPAPKDKAELRSLLGLINYYGRFIRNCSSLLHPLNRLLRNDVKWKWNNDCERSLTKVKNIVSSSQVLTHYSTERPLILATDASSYGIGAVISHVMPDGQEKPIAFASRTLTQSEANYSQLDKEALGIVFGVKRFHNYLFGRKWTLLTDHKPLTSIFHPGKGVPTMAAARLQRWALLLSAYTYDVKYRSNRDHGNADYLSRLPLSTTLKDKPDSSAFYMLSQLEQLPVTNEEIQNKIRKDRILGKVLSMLQSDNWTVSDPELLPFIRKRNYLSLWNGCITYGTRIVIPAALQKRVLEELHTSHLGVVKMKAIARSYVWWPNIDRDIETTAASCESCQQLAHMPNKVPVHPWLYPSGPWQRIHIDYAGPVEKKMLLIVVDAYSKWVEVKIMRSTTTEATISALQEMFSRWGLPEHVHSDNGPQFVSSEFENFMHFNHILHTKSAPHHPQSNGLAERYVQTVKKALKGNSKTSLELRLARFLLQYRNAPSSTTNMTPAELMIGRPVRTLLTLVRPTAKHVKRVQEQQSKMIKDVQEREAQVGDPVRVRNYGVGEKWIEGTVIKRNGGVMYDVVKRHIDQIIPVNGNQSNIVSEECQATGSSNTNIASEECHATSSGNTTVNATSSDNTMASAPPLRRSSRNRRPPQRLIAE